MGREKYLEKPLLLPLLEVITVALQQTATISRQRLRCVLAWSRIPDATKESQLDFCLCIAGAGARVSKGALLLETTTGTALHRCSFTEDWGNLLLFPKRLFSALLDAQPSEALVLLGQGRGFSAAHVGGCVLWVGDDMVKRKTS